MIDLTRPLTELAAEVKVGKVSARELVQASLDRFAETVDYHTVLELNSAALEQADKIDARIAAGEDVGPLAGVPFAAKDNFLTFNTHTTAASHILEPFKAPYQAVAIERLEAAGAILVAKVNLDAFGHGGSTENSDFGPTKNPINPDYVPGGSSGGSATAVALGQVPFALGTDTGGSSRLPASYSGVVGYKPTYGLIPRTGVVAMGSSFDTIGALAGRVEDAAAVLEVLAARDASDATSIERANEPYDIKKSDLTGLKIGVVKEYLGEGVDLAVQAGIRAVIAELEAAGATTREVSLASLDLALACYYILVPAEISSNLARYDGIKFGHRSPEATDLPETYELSRAEGFGPEAKRRIMIGTYVLSSGYYDAYYKRAQQVRTRLIAEFAAIFGDVDVLLGPTAPTPAFKLGAKEHNPLAMYLNDVMTVAANLVGIPAISLPAGTSEGLPYGLQLMAPQRQDRQLLQVAAAVEAVIGDWRDRS